MEDRDIRLGLIRLYILHRATMEPVFARGISENLRRHGFELSPRSVAAILRVLEEKGYLASRTSPGSYATTRRGRRAVEGAATHLRKLFDRGAGFSLRAGL